MKRCMILAALLGILILSLTACTCAAGTLPREADPTDACPDIPVWKFFHGDPDLLASAVITCSLLDCEAGPIPKEITPEETEELRTLAAYGVVTGKASDEMVTGNIWLYSFETPEGAYIMTVEMYRGLLVGPDGMYAYREGSRTDSPAGLQE